MWMDKAAGVSEGSMCTLLRNWWPRPTAPEGMTRPEQLSKSELIRECLIHGIPVWTGTVRGDERAGLVMPSVQDRLRGCNMDVMKLRPSTPPYEGSEDGDASELGKFKVILQKPRLSGENLFKTGGLVQAMTHATFTEQRKMIETTCSYQPVSYRGTVFEWKGDATYLTDCLAVACTSSLWRMVAKKMQQLIQQQPELVKSFILYEIIMKFIEGLCSDDSRTKAEHCQERYLQWKETSGKAPYATFMEFTEVLAAHVEARQELVSEWELPEYDSIERFLSRLLGPLSRAICGKLVDRYSSVMPEKYTWTMVTVANNNMRVARQDPNREHTSLHGKSGLHAIKEESGDGTGGEKEQSGEGVYSMAHGEQIAQAGQGQQRQQQQQQQRQGWQQMQQRQWQQQQQQQQQAGVNRGWGIRGRAQQYRHQLQKQQPWTRGGSSNGMSVMHCACCAGVGTCKAAFACKIYRFSLRFRDPNQSPGQLIAHCVKKEEFKDPKQWGERPAYEQPGRDGLKFWETDRFKSGPTGPAIRQAQLGKRLREYYENRYGLRGLVGSEAKCTKCGFICSAGVTGTNGAAGGGE